VVTPVEPLENSYFVLISPRMAKRPLAIDDGAGEGKQDNMEHHNWYENRQLNLATSPFILGYKHW